MMTQAGTHSIFSLQRTPGTGETPNFIANPERMLEAVDSSSENPCYPRPNLKEAGSCLRSVFDKALEEYEEKAKKSTPDE
jgi:hypothetical protein